MIKLGWGNVKKTIEQPRKNIKKIQKWIIGTIKWSIMTFTEAKIWRKKFNFIDTGHLSSFLADDIPNLGAPYPLVMIILVQPKQVPEAEQPGITNHTHHALSKECFSREMKITLKSVLLQFPYYFSQVKNII